MVYFVFSPIEGSTTQDAVVRDLYHYIQKLRDMKGVPRRFIKGRAGAGGDEASEDSGLSDEGTDQENDEEDNEPEEGVEEKHKAADADKLKAAKEGDDLIDEVFDLLEEEPPEPKLSKRQTVEKPTVKRSAGGGERVNISEPKLIKLPPPPKASPPKEVSSVHVDTESVHDCPTLGTSISSNASKREFLQAEILKVKQTIEALKAKKAEKARQRSVAPAGRVFRVNTLA